MTSEHSRRRWVAASFAGVLLLAVGGGGWLVQRQNQLLRQEELAKLDAIATLKVKQIAAWRAERLADVGLLVESPYFSRAARAWLEAPSAADAALLLRHFEGLARRYGYRNVLLTDSGGEARLSLTGFTGPLHAGTKATLRQAMAAGAPVMSDLHAVEGDAPHLDVVAPLPAAAGKSPWAVVLRCEAAQFLFPLVESWPTPSRTAETLLVRREGEEVVFLNELRHRSGTALRLRLPLTRTDVPAVKAVLGFEGPFEGKDYRGVEVLAALRRIPDSPWYLVAKVDRAEAFASVRRQTLLLVGLLSALGLAGTATLAAAQQRAAKRHFRERLTLQRQLHAAQERQAITLMSIGDAIIVTDREGRVELLNPVAERLTGWEQAEAAGRPLAEVFRIVREDTRQPVADPVARVLERGVVVGLANHTLLISRDGREIPIADSAAPVRSGSGEIVGVVLSFRDQSAEREAQRALEESERRYRTLVENLQEVVFEVTLDGTILDLSPSVEVFTRGQWRREELLGRSMREFWAEPEHRRTYVKRLRTDGHVKDFEATFRNRDGTLVPIAISSRLLFNHAGRPHRIIGTIRDISQRVAQERALRESEARHRQLFLAHPLPMWVYDLESLRFLAVNDAAVAKYGYLREEFLAMTLRDIRPAEELARLEESLARSRAQGGYEESSGWRHRTKDGRLLEVDISSHDISWEGRRARVVIAHDVTARRQLEQQLLQAQKLEAIGTLAGGIAHDFNNLLQALLSGLQAARLRGGDGPFQATFAELEAMVGRGAELARQLLLFARQQPARREAVDAVALLEEHAGMLRRLLPENIELQVEAPRTSLWVEGDPIQLAQVLANLVVNARDAMPAGGRLTIAAAEVAGQVELSVQDTGVGMDEQVRQRIFDPFFTTKPAGSGTGLGLAVVWGIVKDHGGSVQVDSAPGQGTTVRVRLPRAHAAAPAPRHSSSGEHLPVGGGERVLVVEDEEGARGALGELLEMLGYQPTTVASAEQALTLGDEPPFHLLLTDYLLPGMAGVELAARLVDRWPGLKVVVMSGYAPDQLAREMFAAGRAHYLQKPFDMAALARALRTALSEPPQVAP